MKILDARATRAPAGHDMTLAADATASPDRVRLSHIARVSGIAALVGTLAACNVSPTPTDDGAAPAGAFRCGDACVRISMPCAITRLRPDRLAS